MKNEASYLLQGRILQAHDHYKAFAEKHPERVTPQLTYRVDKLVADSLRVLEGKPNVPAGLESGLHNVFSDVPGCEKLFNAGHGTAGKTGFHATPGKVII